ncbi:MAG: hypothetical protein IKF99_01140 [Oscillospiraceae bacterium]|nr:hypothetical protein [Oscillospiraceae bacterium]
MDTIKDGCLLCSLGWRTRRGPKGELVASLEIDGEPVMLCKHHDRLLHGTDEDRAEAFRIMSPYIYGGLKTHARYTEGPFQGKRKEDVCQNW